MYARSLSGLPEVPSITTVIGMEKTDLDGWVGWMAAQSVTQDPRLAESVGSAARLKQVARQSADAAARYRDAAAERGDRVHDYAEQVAQRALGRPHTMAEARARLIEHGEGAYADRFDEWWDLYDVRPIAAEITVWNHTVGYAGTLDLVARIGGRLCLIDYKTKGTGRDGRVKALDPKVVMQLTAGLKAEESLVDPEAGTWEEWRGSTPGLAWCTATSVSPRATPSSISAWPCRHSSQVPASGSTRDSSAFRPAVNCMTTLGSSALTRPSRPVPFVL